MSLNCDDLAVWRATSAIGVPISAMGLGRRFLPPVPNLSPAMDVYTSRIAPIYVVGGGERNPTTPRPRHLPICKGVIRDAVFNRAYGMASYWAKRNSIYPPERSTQDPYSCVADNPRRTTEEFWGDLPNGSIPICTTDSEGLAGELMGPTLASVTQKDVAKESGAQVRYISDPMVAINGRIDPRNRASMRAPRHTNAIRRILYWKRRYRATPAVLCKRDVKGAFELTPVSIRGLPHMVVRYSKYVVIYRPLFCGWKLSAASDGGGVGISSLLMQYVSSFPPGDEHSLGPEGLTACEYVDDGELADPWLGSRPWLSVSVWDYGLHRCCGKASLRKGKKASDGACATRLTLWGLDPCTAAYTVALRPEKSPNPRNSYLKLVWIHGVTRITLKNLHGLRGVPNIG